MESLLDTDLIIRRRGELGLSQRALAREAGLNSAALSLLEAGQNHPELTLRALTKVAAALSIPLHALFIVPEHAEQPASPDDVVIEALLLSTPRAVAREEVARILRWDLERTARAIDALRVRLEGTGAVVHRASNGYLIRPRGDVLRQDDIRALERVRIHSRMMREPGMRLLLQIVREGLPRKWEKTAGNANRVNLRMLVNSGLVVTCEDRYVASSELRTSLVLA